jgi:hypothetical protein
LPDLLDPLTKMQAEALRALASALYPLLGILLVHRFAPGLMERYQARTKQLTERDAERAGRVIEKLNGAFLRALADSVGFQKIVDERAMARVDFAVGPIEGRLDGLEEWRERHTTEDTEVHDRVKGLEVEMKDVRGDISEIKRGQERLSESIEAKWSALKDGLHQAQIAMLKEIRVVVNEAVKK